jgi:DNA (cytosine-5)-methyltransferase 3A
MNVLSLFDGMSCGQIALNRLGIKYDNYFASEIDKYAMEVTKKNYPNTKHIGSVVGVKGEELPKIDLLIGGSPCQSFSFAGKMKGMSTKSNEKILSLERYLELKENGFEFEGQSYLFWEFVRLLKETKPKHFLLENVMMTKDWEWVITKELGIHPIEINSALLSAQNRRRLFWTNIGLIQNGLFSDLVPGIQQPQDKGILLKDVLEDKVDEKYWLSDEKIAYINRQNNAKRMLDDTNKSCCLVATYWKGGRDNQYIVAMRGRYNEEGKIEQKIEPRNDGKTNTLTSVEKDNYVAGGDFRLDEGFRWRDNGKTGTLAARGGVSNDITGRPLANINNKVRRLTPTECERLQTVPDGYTEGVSDTQRYKMLGNGWTIDVICHIFSYL